MKFSVVVGSLLVSASLFSHSVFANDETHISDLSSQCYRTWMSNKNFYSEYQQHLSKLSIHPGSKIMSARGNRIVVDVPTLAVFRDGSRTKKKSIFCFLNPDSVKGGRQYYTIDEMTTHQFITESTGG